MTKVIIEPGICKLNTSVTAVAGDEDEPEAVKVQVKSGCEAVRKMMDALGEDFSAYEVCLAKPGKGPFFEYASANFPVHAGCPVIAGITKCIEAECGLALKCDAAIRFVDA